MSTTATFTAALDDLATASRFAGRALKAGRIVRRFIDRNLRPIPAAVAATVPGAQIGWTRAQAPNGLGRDFARRVNHTAWVATPTGHQVAVMAAEPEDVAPIAPISTRIMRPSVARRLFL